MSTARWVAAHFSDESGKRRCISFADGLSKEGVRNTTIGWHHQWPDGIIWATGQLGIGGSFSRPTATRDGGNADNALEWVLVRPTPNGHVMHAVG